MSKTEAEVLLSKLTDKAIEAVDSIPNSELLKRTAEFLRDRTV
jgi:hypothetical protein